MSIAFRSARLGGRYALVLGSFCVALASPSLVRAANGDDVLKGLNSLTVSIRVLSARIERETTKVARRLTPEGRRVMHQSMIRFFAWAEGYCQGDAGCLRNRYYNYLESIPNSVYRAGPLTVYDTGIYALEWPDEDLQSMQPHYPPWNMHIIWPRVDLTTTSNQAHVPLSDAAKRALAARTHKVMTEWIEEGQDQSLEVHLESVNECYVTATITGSRYTGGAHPYESYSAFNWNVRANRAVQNSDLFKPDVEWKSEIVALYRQRLQASGAELSEWTLSSEGMGSVLTDGFVITDNGIRFLEHEGATRNERVPAVSLEWRELAPWLTPGAICSMQ